MNTFIQNWPKPEVESRIAAHIRAWEAAKLHKQKKVGEVCPFITISREFGCDGLLLAQDLVESLNGKYRPSIPWVAYDRELLHTVAQNLDLRDEVVESLDMRRRDEMTELFDAILVRKVDEAIIFRKLAEIVRSTAIHGNAILVGRGAYLLTKGLPKGLHIRIVAPLDWRVQKIARERKIPEPEAEAIVREGAISRERFIQTFFRQDHPFIHDLVINNAEFGVAQMAKIIATALHTKFGE